MTDATTHLDIETLSAFADGELNAVGAARAERHLGECASCRASLERVRRLVVAAQALPATEAPPPEVWTGIRDRLQRPAAIGAPRRWWHNGWLATAAAVVLVVGTAVLATMAVPRAKATKPPAVAANAAMPNVVLAVDGNYLATVRELRGTLDAQRATLAPSTVRVVERSLAVIDTAIAEARAALAADPASVTLVDILTAQYERKVDLLQRATQLSPSI